ncbi:MAG TPA: transposase, partial [Nitrospiria bacterium]|nr:transposase [Nitrospiria bacterium]
MYRAYAIRLKTTRKQSETLNRLLAQLCELYNMALQQRRDVWRSHQKGITLKEQDHQLTDLRSGCDEYWEFPRSIQRSTLKRIDLAFQGMFRRIRSGEAPGYPRFKPLSQFNSFDVDLESMMVFGKSISITKIGTIKFKTRCKIKGNAKMVRISRCGGRWNARLICDIGDAPEKKSIGSVVGIDLGVSSLVTLSNGADIPNPRWERKFEGQVAAAVGRLKTKKKGSKNRSKAVEAVRSVHRRISGHRREYLHSISSSLVRD